jgi:hypothetical protein
MPEYIVDGFFTMLLPLCALIVWVLGFGFVGLALCQCRWSK